MSNHKDLGKSFASGHGLLTWLGGAPGTGGGGGRDRDTAEEQSHREEEFNNIKITK